MKKSTLSVLAFVLLTVLASGCAPASTPVPPTATPKPDAYVGEWSGTTDQGYEIRLVVKVESGQQYVVEVGYKIEFPGWGMQNSGAKFDRQIPISVDGCFENDPEWMLGISGCFSGDKVSGKLVGRPEARGWMQAGDEVSWAPEGADFVGETGFTATR